MITKVFGHNIKGQEFSQEIGQRTIFAGPNGAGKTGRTQAIVMAILGHVPGVSKTNPEIHAAFATAPKMAVAIELDGGVVFKRVFDKDKNGKVSQSAFINGVKTAMSDFPLEMVRAGVPDIYQTDAFIGMSDRAKLAEITRLFPPAGDLDNVNAKIQELKGEVNKLQNKKEGLTSAIKTLEINRSKIETPPGTRADIEKAIDFNASELEAQYKIRGEMLKAEAEAKAAAEKEEERKRSEAALKRADELAKANAVIAEGKAEEARRKAELDGIEKGKREQIAQQAQATADAAKQKEAKKAAAVEKKAAEEPVIPAKAPVIFQPVLPQPIESLGYLKEIKEVMANAGCEECAALSVIDLKIRILHRRYEDNRTAVTI